MTASTRIETRLTGLPLSNGLAVARVCMFNEHRHSNLPLYRVSGTGVQHEQNRVDRAIAITRTRLGEIERKVRGSVGKAEAEIFVAQAMIVDDPALRQRVMQPILEEGMNAEAAVAQALDAYEARLMEVDNEYLKERASDFGEIKRRLLDVLSNLKPSLQCSEGHCQKGKNRIIVAEELTPSLAVDLDTGHTMGFVTERGGRESHAAILARALGIPAVSRLSGIRDKVSCGAEILVDGTSGEVILWPAEKTIADVRSRHGAAMRLPLPLGPVAGLKVMANVGTASDVKDAAEMRAEGIGLYRTELDLIAARRMLSEDELYERYLHVLKVMPGQTVVYRLFDIGSDKPVPFLQIPREDNPSLGWRGVRLLLARRELLRVQARALTRVAQHGPIHVLYPMIADVNQFRRVRESFREECADLPSGEIRHGVMLEVPSACLRAREILDVADFASIGTNDLVQYLFAVDRNNALVAADYNPSSPVLWDLMASMVGAAAEAGKPLSVCGEIGSDPLHIPRLIDVGIRIVSMSPRSISGARMAAEKKLAEGRAV